MRPLPTVSGSSVTSGRCCAIAGAAAPISSSVLNTARPSLDTCCILTVSLIVNLELLAAVEQQRNRAIVDQLDLHVRLEYAGLDRHSRAAQLADGVFVERLRGVRRCRLS